MSEKFGYYKPRNITFILEFLRKLGISRGTIRRQIQKIWERLGYEVVDATIHGIKYRLNIKENTTDAKILTTSKFYDLKEIDALACEGDKSQKDKVFIDIGANTGHYSLSLAKRGFTKIIAIEPNPPTLELLNFNVSINDLDEIITIVPLCIGEGDKVPFYCGSGLGTASVIRENSDNTPPIYVETETLINILNNQNIIKIDSMKIDIEGFEDQALFPFFDEAPEKLWPRCIVIEPNSKSWKRDILKHLETLGYQRTDKTRGNIILTLKT